MKRNFWREKNKIFFIGIGGVSMSALALCLKKMGFCVSGSDTAAGAAAAKLEKAGISVYPGHDASRVAGKDAVVYSSAIKEDDPELREARRLGIPAVPRAELLSLVAGCFEKSVGVAGCHGKTTATAMCAHVLQACSGSCTAHIGGEDFGYGNFHDGGDRYFVTEACEYRANFLLLRPDVAVVLNTDADHLECYGSEAALAEAYDRFAGNAGAAVVCGDDPIAGRVRAALTFGLSSSCDVGAERLRACGGKYSFHLRIGGKLSDRIALNVYGKHNVFNALAAAAVAEYFGYPPAFTAEGLRAFRGIRRRFEHIGTFNGADVIADYAHHPREIAAALATAREICGGRLFVIFQPHTYSRTRLLFGDFLSVLSGVPDLVIYKTFAAREYFDAEGSALTLAEHLPNSLYAETTRELAIYLECSVRAGDTVLFLGAGDIYTVACRLVRC